LKIRISGAHSAGPAVLEGTSAASKIVLRVDRASVDTRHDTERAWIPHPDMKGREEIDLVYDPKRKQWTSTGLFYKFDRHWQYSAYIEEREAILTDDLSYSSGSSIAVRQRVVYADRILLSPS
jgi:hypothetical protein